MIAIDLSKHQALDTDPKGIQINFSGNLSRAESETFFYYLRSERHQSRLFTRNCESFVNVFDRLLLFNIISL